MCGISGALVFNKSVNRLTEDYLTKIRDTMTNRGPDGGANWINSDKNVGLSHRRLSIIDLSDTANQPMSNLQKNIYIVFNGEIYNHKEIKDELNTLKQYTWITDHSDTEVIIHAYEQWGIECVHKLRGMFAFALWDNTIKKLWLVRDRLGIKPLYFSFIDNKVVFASEIKAILQDDKCKREVNEDAFIIIYHL